jgi:hypothetical protein
MEGKHTWMKGLLPTTYKMVNLQKNFKKWQEKIFGNGIFMNGRLNYGDPMGRHGKGVFWTVGVAARRNHAEIALSKMECPHLPQDRCLDACRGAYHPWDVTLDVGQRDCGVCDSRLQNL